MNTLLRVGTADLLTAHNNLLDTLSFSVSAMVMVEQLATTNKVKWTKIYLQGKVALQKIDGWMLC